ncbi:hypothetical protein VTH06DRAFT_5123 [Thermothelomyces fergusii]
MTANLVPVTRRSTSFLAPWDMQLTVSDANRPHSQRDIQVYQQLQCFVMYIVRLVITHNPPNHQAVSQSL